MVVVEALEGGIELHPDIAGLLQPLAESIRERAITYKEQDNE